ncbi:hypothetical protein OIU77_009807 [Salix suchowensis]|uniref:Uncharacterized protein n=1 Tax=Salix suchowensis TaxID=1278906 RepID=A0ABQ9A659_9ROSI|nr:hypothetical protein OIU77_009807 [Salix suchowensis]
MRQACIRDTESLSPRHRSSKTRVSYTLYKPSPSNPFSTSSSRSSFSNSKSRSGFIGWYLSQLESRPVVTKTFTTSLIYAAADLTAQLISSTSSSSLDFIRTLRMAGYVYGPANTALFFSYNAALQGESNDEIVARLKLPLQPLVNSVCSYVWTIYLTYMASLKKASTD